MEHTTYPIDADIETLFLGAEISFPDAFSFNGYAAMARQEFERRTGRIPFLIDAEDEVRVFDPPGAISPNSSNQYVVGGGKVVQLMAGLLELTSVTLGGQVKVLGTDFRLMPMNAPKMRRPYEWLQFFYIVYGVPSSLVVTGKWGWGAEIPEDAWKAMIRLGGCLALRDLLQAQSIGIASWTDGDVSESNSPALLAKVGAAWEEFATPVIERYKFNLTGF